ncbi:3,4-dihydroxy-2-butanone-4-phosphate synthase [Actinophytocola sp.]|uniref:3,4-dihydroxy-2-butanone-4-phosphate synthase n=1 Tax=Actinophytocola sp. TaxID=1872138 RepID=UPI002ED131F6
MTELAGVDRAIAEIADGRPVVVSGGDGDLVFAAEHASPELVAFTVRHTSGFVCVALSGEDCDRLELPPMYPRVRPRGEEFTVAVDARDTGTGISATDRANTIRLLADPHARPPDFTRPGHIAPIRAADGGVLERAGRAEAALDLVRLAGLSPAAALSGIVSRRSVVDMAGPGELADFAAEHRLAMVTTAELVARRRQTTDRPLCHHCGAAI